MTDEQFVQAFWSLAFFVMFIGSLVIGGIIRHFLVDPGYRRYLKLQKAKAAWAKMLENANAPKET